MRGGGLQGIEYRLPVPSAQVKSAVLLAGLGADGPTTVHEAVPTRAHTEEMLAAAGADIEVRTAPAGAQRGPAAGPAPGRATSTSPPTRPRPPSGPSPPAPPRAATWCWRTSTWAGAGPASSTSWCAWAPGSNCSNEDPVRHTADIHVQAGPLVATHVGGAEVPSLIDEIPVLCVAAAFAEGTTTFADAAELRVKETDRVATTVALLRALGVGAEPRAGRDRRHRACGAPLRGGTVDSYGDHRIAMAAAVAALGAGGPVTVKGWDATATSYPSFEEDMLRCLS